MEDILASIRRIIADDSAPPPQLTHAREGQEGALADESHGPVAVARVDEPITAERSLHASHEGPVHDGTVAVGPTTEDPAVSELAPELSRHPLAPPEVAGHGSVELEPEPPIPPLHDRDPHAPVGHDESAHESIPHGYVPRTEAVPAGPSETARLVSPAVDSAVTAAFNALAASRFVDNSEQLTGLVREMIGPFVKAWIDENLPGMVERIVVAEIERMARR